MLLSVSLTYQDNNIGEFTKAFLKSYWFVIGAIFGIVVYLIEQKFRK